MIFYLKIVSIALNVVVAILFVFYAVDRVVLNIFDEIYYDNGIFSHYIFNKYIIDRYIKICTLVLVIELIIHIFLYTEFNLTNTLISGLEYAVFLFLTLVKKFIDNIEFNMDNKLFKDMIIKIKFKDFKSYYSIQKNRYIPGFISVSVRAELDKDIITKILIFSFIDRIRYHIFIYGENNNKGTAYSETYKEFLELVQYDIEEFKKSKKAEFDTELQKVEDERNDTIDRLNTYKDIYY